MCEVVLAVNEHRGPVGARYFPAVAPRTQDAHFLTSLRRDVSLSVPALADLLSAAAPYPLWSTEQLFALRARAPRCDEAGAGRHRDARGKIAASAALSILAAELQERSLVCLPLACRFAERQDRP